MKKLNLFTVVDIGIHALLVSIVILLLRKISAHGLQFEAWEFTAAAIISLAVMVIVALIQTVLGRRIT